MASKFKMDVNTFLMFANSNFFVHFWLNLAYYPSFQHKTFLKKLKMAEKFNMANFCKKITIFW
jgi:hypothetical protein